RLAAGKRILAHQVRIATNVADKSTVLRPAVEMSSAPDAGVEFPRRLHDKISDLSRDNILALAPRKRFGQHIVLSLGKILVLKQIGQGGMGAVYLGYNPRMQKEVAVKVLSATLFRERTEAVARFYREAQ